jgi:hypothetical protein
MTILITATKPFYGSITTDAERAEFMAWAQQEIIHAGMPLLDEESFEGVNEILDYFDLENADCNDDGYVVPIKDRDCAVRLLDAGLLDQTAEEIEERWGPVRPSTDV